MVKSQRRDVVMLSVVFIKHPFRLNCYDDAATELLIWSSGLVQQVMCHYVTYYIIAYMLLRCERSVYNGLKYAIRKSIALQYICFQPCFDR